MSLEKRPAKLILAGTCGVRMKTVEISRATRGIHASIKAGKSLSQLNTMRGGVKGFKGFVAEIQEAAEASAQGRMTVVLNNNGVADLQHTLKNGQTAFKQVKAGYRPGQIDYARYRGQTIVIDKDNPNFALIKKEGAQAGVKVVRGHFSNENAKFWADAMQMETKITGAKRAVITPKIYTGVQTAARAHSAGISAAKGGAVCGAGLSIGSNLVELARGNKTVGEATVDVAVDTAGAAAVGYVSGAVGSVVAETAVGAAAIETAGAVGAAAMTVPGVGAAVGAAGAAAGAIGGVATSAVSAGAALATSAAAGTVAAGAVAAAGAAAVAAAPVLAVGVVVGGVLDLIFGD